MSVLLASCATVPSKTQTADSPAAAPAVEQVVLNHPAPVKTLTPAPNPRWQASALSDLPGWQNDSVLAAWPALQRSCTRLSQRQIWLSFCEAVKLTPTNEETAKNILLSHLNAYAQADALEQTMGVATAYFEPVYTGSLLKGGAFQWPLYAAPATTVNLSRDQLTPTTGTAHPILQGNELVWLDNPIDPFLAQVQGSVRIQLADGSIKRLGFSSKNGQPYVSIANTLIRQGVFTTAQASMERIKAWATGKDKATVQAVLNTNPSFVFFKWLDTPAYLGPIGALNVPLSPMRSVAVDTAFTPLGTPIWLETTTANGALKQLMLAQDVGSAIKGAARVDIYVGTGEAAGLLASQQKNPSKVWVLWPK